MFDFDDLPEEYASIELERAEVSLGGMKAAVCRRPLTSPIAPISVIMLPGNPVMGGFHAGQPLPLAVDKELGKAGFPVVRFDWMGTGMNYSSKYKPTEDYSVTFKESCRMFEVAKKLGERVCVCAWNYSGPQGAAMCIPGQPYFFSEVCALISLSYGYKQWELVSSLAGKEAGEALKAEFHSFSLVDVPTLYVFGSKDKHTPLEDVERITKARKDKGTQAAIHVIDQTEQKLHPPEYFVMQEKEDDVAEVCSSWLQHVRSKLLVNAGR